MNQLSNRILLFLSVILLFSSCKKTSLIILSNEKNIYAQDMGFGVSIQPPTSFKKAKSYIGYQAPNKMGSISLEVEDNYEQLISNYSETAIDAKEGKIYRHQPVSYNGNTDAFYVEYYDNPQKRYRLALIIKTNDKVYHIKGFHRGKQDHPLSNKIRKAILTSYIGEFQKEEKPFSKVFIADDFETIKYTRDNKFPTEEADSMVVYVTTLSNGYVKKYNERKFLEDRIKAITNGKTSNDKEPLANGAIYKCISKNETKNVIGILLISDQNDATIIECIGNKKANLKQVSNYMLSQVISIM